MGATGESVRRLTDFGYNPAWSPDGDEIVCAKGEGVGTSPNDRNVNAQLWAVKVSTGAERLITEGDAVQPSWSPNGSRIAYWCVGDPLHQSDDQSEKRDSGQRDIWTISAGGGEPRPVTSDPWLDWNPVWSHDGRHLYFSSDRSGTLNLWRVPIYEASGEVLGDPVAVTTPSAWVGHMSIARDGRRIAYTSNVRIANLYKIGFDPVTESVEDRPTSVLEDSRLPLSPDLSPDGRLLAFSLVGKMEDIAVIGSDGSGLRKLTDDPYKDRFPRWSPDGEQITFYSDRSGIYQVWSIHPDGSGLRQLTDSTTDVFCSIWSPDGASALSFLDSWDGSQVRGFLWNPTQPWHEQTPKFLASQTSGDGTELWLTGYDGAWSPDGRKIAGLVGGSRDFSTYNFAVYDLASQRYRIVTNSEVASGELAPSTHWLNDGQRLLFLDNRGILKLLDTESEERNEILSVDQGRVGSFCLSKSNDFIYFLRVRDEADIWMLTLDEER